jgi:hypothetical protein
MMFEYFPDNYPWSIALQMSLNAGANMSEADVAMRPLKQLSARNDDVANGAWHDAWVELGERNVRLVNVDMKLGRTLSAGKKFPRAATYFTISERIGKSELDKYLRTYKTMLKLFDSGVKCTGLWAHRNLVYTDEFMR